MAVLFGTNNSENIQGTAGDDFIYGLGGNDSINGAGGRDALYGNQQNDLLFGSSDRDTMFGGQGNDNVEGSSGRDDLYGDSDNDTLNGGSDIDTFTGGSGSDLFILSTTEFANYTRDFNSSEGDDVVLTNSPFALVVPESDVIGIESVSESSFSETPYAIELIRQGDHLFFTSSWTEDYGILRGAGEEIENIPQLLSSVNFNQVPLIDLAPPTDEVIEEDPLTGLFQSRDILQREINQTAQQEANGTLDKNAPTVEDLERALVEVDERIADFQTGEFDLLKPLQPDFSLPSERVIILEITDVAVLNNTSATVNLTEDLGTIETEVFTVPDRYFQFQNTDYL